STAIRGNQNIAKFADTGIAELVKQMERMGASRARMVAKIAGGATMFQSMAKSDLMNVGERNAAASKAVLKQLNIPLLAADTGANYGRTVTFFPETGEYHIRAVGKPEKII
ncbi:MAG: chemotaxis protein CheD, partial [Acetatifactor sp.]|nr:chemotaxis protein CheD [Acetatifactor sp.]